MKHWIKQWVIYIGLLLIATTTLVLCKKNSTKEVVKMTYEQLTKEVSSDIAFALFDRAGKTEADPASRGGKRVKANATVDVIEDLLLTNPGGHDYESTTSPNADWFAFQAFVTGATPDPNAGAKSYCNHYYGSLAPPPTELCTIVDDSGKTIRTFTSDDDGTVHLSNKIVKT